MNNLYLKPVEESIKNTQNSKAYRTRNNVCIKDLKWGVANDSLDGRYIYLHVLNAPEGQTLKLSAPADKSELLREAVIMNFDGTTTPVFVEKDGSGYAITLPDGMTWHEVDTVIKVERLLQDTPAQPDEPTDEEGTEIQPQAPAETETTPSPEEEPDTDGDTGADTSADTRDTDTPVEDITTAPPAATEEKGCGSIVTAGVAIIAILGTAIIMKKRD